MIYANLLYFIAAIVLFSAAPQTENTAFPPIMNFLSIFLLLWVFRYFNKFHFTTIRERFDDEEISAEEAKRAFTSRSNIHIIIAIFMFAVEIFFFDLKTILIDIPVLGSSKTLTNTAGVVVFLFHLAIVWYWAFRAMGDVLDIGKSANDYIRGNIKFNLVIVLPWLFLSIFLDIASLINTFYVGYVMILFLLLLVIFFPEVIVTLWDCKPIADGNLKNAIYSLSKAQGVKFRGIMSWNALNKTLVTAGVVGLIARFRYLMITPQLMRLLDEEEILAVASHEIGHVKKRHLILYLIFFTCFMILFFTMRKWLIFFLISTDFGLSLIVTGNGADSSAISFYDTIFFVVLAVVYFRFVFGYFMRNFERQADAYCFEAGIGPDPMISSFMKLGMAVGDDGKKSNWHHYGIGQRIDFLRKCIADPGQIKQHNRKVNRSLIIFFSVLLILSILIVPFNRMSEWPNETAYYNYLSKVIEKKVQQSPQNAGLYTTLAGLYYELEKWEPAKKAYEITLALNYRQPGALNNLAWLLLKCPQEDLRDHKAALKLAVDAARLQEESHILDTLAEAYLANGMYKEALAASEKALKIAKEDRDYLEDQVKKMKKRFRESKVIKI